MKPEVYTIIYKKSVPTSKKTQSTSITNTNWSMLFREIITVYHENETKHKYSLDKTHSFKVTAGDAHSYHCPLKG